MKTDQERRARLNVPVADLLAFADAGGVDLAAADRRKSEREALGKGRES